MLIECELFELFLCLRRARSGGKIEASSPNDKNIYKREIDLQQHACNGNFAKKIASFVN